MKAEKGFIVYPDYVTIEDKTFIHLYGRLENGQSFVTISDFEPYFFIKEKDQKKISKYLKKYKVEKTKLTNFSGDKVVKISSTTRAELNKLHHHIVKKVDTYEADIRPYYRFIMDHDLLGNIEISGDYQSSEKIDRIYNNPKILSPSESKVKLKVASVDIEADQKGLFCIGIHSEDFHKTFMVVKKPVKNLKNIVQCNSEADCLDKFRSKLHELDPDIITGWNFIDFDLVYLRTIFAKHKIPFDIGRNNSSVKLRIEAGFFRSSSADVPGRLVLDGMNLIRDPFIKEAPTIKHAEFASFSLENVSLALLKKGKLIKGSGKIRHDIIEKLFKTQTTKSLQELADYNLMDCKLVYDILEKTKMVDLAIERSQLTGLPLDKITGSIASFDSLYIRLANKKGLVSPTTHFGRKEERITGGYVQLPDPGIYHNVLVLDFKSLYPSVMKTYNIDPASHLEHKEKNSIETANKAYFKNQDGILPEILEKLHKAREKAKHEKRELSVYAIKIIMNSFFGVLASPNCRYFSMDVANAITQTSQSIIKLAAKEIEKMGYKIIYSDTDSLFVNTDLGKTKANVLGKKIESHINNFYDKYIKKTQNRKSYLELEFEKQYISLMIPQLRGKAKGAKKRYAGLIEKNGKEHIEIVGLEAIRGDWTDAAQEFQVELLKRVFHKKEITSFIKSYIKKVKAGDLDKKLMYRKSIRKALSEYVKTTPPHVKAARKLDKLESNIIEYYITTDGPEPIQKLKHKLDYKHYIDKQIKPIAQQILTLFDKDFDDVVEGSKQAKLF